MLRRSYKRRLINDEALVKCMHQHWIVVALPVIYTILLVAPLVAILVTIFDSTWGRVLFVIVLIGGLAVWARYALPPLARWYTTSYAVTSRRVLFRKGVLNKNDEQVELRGVSNPMLSRRWWDVVLGTGTIDLGADQSMTWVPHASSISHLVRQLAAEQSKDTLELARTLRSMGYGNLTMK